MSQDLTTIALRAAIAANQGTLPSPSDRAALVSTAPTIDMSALPALFDQLLTAPNPTQGLSLLMASPIGVALLPEVAALDMAQPDRKLHKDNLTHSITVAAQAQPRLRLRWAALLHDIGKPPTRKIEGTKVTFYNHEQVGRSMARSLLTRLGYASSFATQVATLVEISGRTHGFDDTWTDAALRRFVLDAGDLLDDALDLSRADCTSARPGRRAQILAQVDAVAARIAQVQAADARKAVRPALSGSEIMEILDLTPSPAVGRAYRYLLELALDGAVLDRDEATARLLEWAAHSELG
jgi:poly(A) polymerase